VGTGLSIRSVQAGAATVRVIDVDLGAPGIRVEVAADDIARREGLVTGRVHTMPEWLEKTGAAAGINGGFFGRRVGENYREVIGLLKLDGRVRSVAPTYHSTKTGESYSRSAFGITAAGRPYIDWVTGRPGDTQVLRSHSQPEVKGAGGEWNVEDAVACGPRLIANGKISIAYRGERLASPGLLPRTFLGHGLPTGKARHLVLCTADGMEFEDCARFMMEYFQRQYGVPCAEAMCLDGGGSTQAVWREKAGEGTRIAAEPLTAASVPTAILVYADGAGK
jgi:exopolysaccharide biosynthesis protein